MNKKKSYKELENEIIKLRKELNTKKNETFLNDYLENNKAIMLQIDFETKQILNANQKALNFYGYPKEELLNKTINDLNIMSDDEIRNLMQKSVQQKANRFEFKHRIANNEIKDVEVYSSNFKINGKLYLFITIFDITERKQAELNLKESESNLRKSNKTKDMFFSIIAHDLRSPFNSLLGFSKILNSNFDNYDIKKQKKIIEIIHSGIKNTYKLLDNLLLWSRAQNGKIDFNPEKLNLFLIVQETIQINKQSSESKAIKISNLISKEINIFADKQMLMTIFRNLISNAIKFTLKKGKIKIDAQIVNSENNKKIIEIVIIDNGVGISKEIQSKLFNIGENISTNGTEEESGTGLGLILCKEFITKHGGEIWIESKEGKGSSFYFTIPLIS